METSHTYGIPNLDILLPVSSCFDYSEVSTKVFRNSCECKEYGMIKLKCISTLIRSKPFLILLVGVDNNSFLYC